MTPCTLRLLVVSFMNYDFIISNDQFLYDNVETSRISYCSRRDRF